MFLLIPILMLFHGFLGASPLRPMTYEDIVTLEKPQYTALSPEGNRVAFVTSRGCIEENRNIDTLRIRDLKTGKQSSFFEADKILDIQWGNEALYSLVQEGKEYKILRYMRGRLSTLVSSLEPITLFRLSGDGNSLYYTLVKKSSDETMKRRCEEGYVYQWGKDFVVDLAGPYRDKEYEEIWKSEFGSNQRSLITQLSVEGSHKHYDFIRDLQPSKNGRYLLIQTGVLGNPTLGETPFKSEIIVWDTVQNRSIDVLPYTIRNRDVPCWVDETRFVFQESLSFRDLAIYLCDVNSNKTEVLDWLNLPQIEQFFADKKVYAMSGDSLNRISIDEKKIETLDLPEGFSDERFSFVHQTQCLSSIVESSNVPPDVVVYNLEEKKIIDKTSLNPQLDEIARGEVEKVKIRWGENRSATGYLVHPVGEEPGQRYPIIIATYGFWGKFIADAEWHSTFPAQTLASEGYLVLLLNAPGGAQSLVGDSVEMRKGLGWDRLHLFERAVDALVEQGIGDPTKVGIYGWSHGAFIVNFLITHSNKFHVACLGEGGDFNPGCFWLCGAPMWARIFENTFGGPPWGASLQSYLDFSPFFHVDKIKTPLLLEFAAEAAFWGFEMYVPLRYLGVPAELVAYKGEEHNFVKPKARVASMARKVDWFNFWLLDKQDNNPEKQEQYEGWMQMREQVK